MRLMKQLSMILCCFTLFVFAGCGDSSSVSGSSSGVTLAKSVFSKSGASALQDSQTPAVKSAVSGSPTATYNPANGQVVIPQLQVSGDTSGATYSVEMMPQGSFFVVTGVTPVGTATLTSSMATFAPSTGLVVVPFMVVAGDASGAQYTVSLQQQGGTLNFSVANVAPVVQANFTAVAGTYSVLSPNKGIITVDSNGNLIITESGAVIGSGKLTTTSSSTLFNFTASFMDGDTLQGTLDTTTGQFSGSKNNSEALGVFAQKLEFTTAMLSGKTFSIYTDCGASGATRVGTFNTNGTITTPGTTGGTWSINGYGQLIANITSESYSEVNTLTLTSVTATGLIASDTWVSNSNNSGTCTWTATVM